MKTRPPASGSTSAPADRFLTRPTHPGFVGSDADDPLTIRLRTLMLAHPGLISFRADDLATFGVAMKQQLIADYVEALGLDVSIPRVIPTDG